MIDYASLRAFSPTTLAELLTRESIMDIGIRPLWSRMPRVAGPAFTVACAPGDNLMLHAAIYRAAPGSVIVVEAGDLDYAVAGGNVCAVAQKQGVSAFVVDGVVRDLAEIRENRFPVFARGIIPIPGKKAEVGALNVPVRCGGIQVTPGDIVVADEEGIVVVPFSRLEHILDDAHARSEAEAACSLEDWEISHRSRTEELLQTKGFVD